MDRPPGHCAFVWSVIGGIREFTDVGYDLVYVHQVGADQEGFFRFYEQEVLPKL